MHARNKSPHHAVLAIGVVCATLALFLDLRPVLAVANVFTLVWYFVVQLDALKLPKEKRLVPAAVTWFAFIGCAATISIIDVIGMSTRSSPSFPNIQARSSNACFSFSTSPSADPSM